MLTRQLEDLRAAGARWEGARRSAAEVWRDDVFQAIDSRYLRDVSTEHRHVTDAVARLQAALNEINRLLAAS